MSIKITADSTCDLSAELIERYDIDLVPLFVSFGGNSYKDGVDVMPEDIYRHVAAGGEIANTAAPAPAEFHEIFEKYAGDREAIIHISLSSKFSSSYQNACIAAEEFDNVYVVDSMNLSTGHGLVVLEAADMAKEGLPPTEIAERLRAVAPKVNASFILDDLTYLRKGGRCSTVAALGANVLSLKPCIEVVDGAMRVGTKYRGSFEKCIRRYVKERVENKKLKRVFLTDSGMPEEWHEAARNTLREFGNFEEMIETVAGCTVSSHCGPNTFGVLFIDETR